MARTVVSGDQSIAYGALLAGVRVVTSYPGSPSSATIHTLASFAESHRLHVEWSTNEKVAFETAFGASIGGVPAMMGCKSVGFNVALDPIMIANLTDVGAGLVILLGDDPGAWASQNDQDTRLIASGTELPILEPATPREGMDATISAFALSREFQIPVIVRITKSFGAMKQEMHLPDIPPPPAHDGGHAFKRERMRWICLPANAVPLHRRLHERLEALYERFEHSPFNTISGSGTRGILASGFTHTKLMDVLGTLDEQALAVLKIGTTAPLPARLITEFLRGVDEVLVLEENEPFIERQIKAIAYDAGLRVPVRGKEDRLVPREGELFRWQIAELLPRFWPGFSPARAFSPEEERKYMPSVAGLPENCPYTPVFEMIQGLSAELGLHPVYVVDPGCAVKINTPPFETLDVKYSMGSSIGIASGLVMAGITDPVIAVIGDSSFFHLGVNALLNVAHHRSNLLVLVLDNATTALSGFQPTPGLDVDALGHETPALSIEGIIGACPVDLVRTIDPWEMDTARDALMAGLTSPGLRVIISRSPCPYIETKFCPGYKPGTQAQPMEVEP